MMMRIGAVALILMLAPATGAETLHFVGDGENVDLSESIQGVDRTWAMSLEGHGGAETTYELRGPQDEGAFRSDAVPTFVYDGPVTIAEGPVLVYVYVNDSNQLGCNSLDGQLFDGAGNALGPADHRVDIAGSGEVVEVLFEFDDISGSFDGLAFQAASPWTDCGALPYTFHWGDDGAAGRIEFTAPEAPEMPTIFEELNGPLVAIEQDVTASNNTYQFNWTQGETPMNVTFNATVGAGSANITIRDRDGSIVFERHVAEQDAGTAKIETGSSGDWTIHINHTNFTGSLSLLLEPPQAPSPPDDTGDPPGSSDEPSNDTADPGASNVTAEGEQSPVPALPVVAAGLGVAAWLRRRSA